MKQASSELGAIRPKQRTPSRAIKIHSIRWTIGYVSTTNRCPSRIGRFEIQEELGRGGFGVVLRATDPRLNRDVALKIPRASSLLHPEIAQAFSDEKPARRRCCLTLALSPFLKRIGSGRFFISLTNMSKAKRSAKVDPRREQH